MIFVVPRLCDDAVQNSAYGTKVNRSKVNFQHVVVAVVGLKLEPFRRDDDSTLTDKRRQNVYK